MLSPEDRLANAGAQIFEINPQHKSNVGDDAGSLQFEITIASKLAGKPIPERDFIVPGWIPRRQVTLISGDGGTGKTLIAQQLQVAASLGGSWLGMPIIGGPMPTFGLYTEDDDAELHIRLNDITSLDGIDIARLDNMYWRSGVVDPCELVEVDKGGMMKKTPYFEWLERTIKQLGAKLVVLDAAANLYGGDEINRRQVKSFITMLRQLAVEIDGAIVLLAHPSVQGIQTGTGLSGSTSWNNSVRSRLYLNREKSDKGEEADPNVRVLTKMKSNYSSTGDKVRVRWTQGAFIALDTSGTLDKAATSAKADRVFLALLKSQYESSVWVSHLHTSRNYAPTTFSLLDDREGLGKDALAKAMNRLLKDGIIAPEQYGRPSDPRFRLVAK